ncbi:MAG: hypothetical protein CMK59_02465 [Proteobacteria bacterium]|nr:hypothetical protein [Pseudomonadota bacterium]
MSETETDLEQSQELLGKAIEHAKMGEDKDLATRIRTLGERFVRILYGLLKMTEIHDLENQAFIKPIAEFRESGTSLSELLGVIHMVLVEDQVFVNDIRIRMNITPGASTLSEELRPHKVGGISFHEIPNEEQTKLLITLLSNKPAESSPRAALIETLSDNGLGFLDLTGIYRFRIAGEASGPVKKDVQKVSSRAASLVEESWDNLSANRAPNPLPLRRAVTDILAATKSDEAGGLSEDGKGSDAYGAHALKVCQLSLMIARGAGLSEETLQDLGVAAMFHDMGYAVREGADPANGFEGFPPPFERHAAAGARLILKQRGFHQAKINRALATLEHHKDFKSDSGTPSVYARILRIAEDYSNFTRRKGQGLNPHEALSRMASAAGQWYDPILFQIFVNRMGKYPPGTLLEVSIPIPKEGTIQELTFVLLSQSLVRSPESFDKPLCRLVRTHDGYPCPDRFKNRKIDLANKGVVQKVLNDLTFVGELQQQSTSETPEA